MMTRFFRFASYLALASLAVPAAAQQRSAAYETSADRSAAQPFMFSGATFRVPLGGRTAGKPELALRMAGGFQSHGLAPKIGEGLAFSAARGGKPALTLAGQDSKVIGKRLQMSDGAKAALIIGGVVVIGLGVAFAVGADKFDDEPLDW